MSISVVVQSRLSSSRLPGKAALTLAGRPAVVLCAQRAAHGGLPVIVATSSEPEDDVIASELAQWGIDCYRGSLDDPLDRFAKATQHLEGGDIVVRLTADNVVPNGDFVREMVAAVGPDGYLRVAAGMPYGLSAEAFRVDLLRAAASEATTAFDREHVTPFIRRQTTDAEHIPSVLRGRALTDPVMRVRCTIDNLEDYRTAHKALQGAADPVTVGWLDLLQAWADQGAARANPLPGTRRNPIGQGPWVLGTVQLGMSYGIANTTGEPSAADATRLLATASAAGVTHLDTARTYGASETRIGTNLRRGMSESLGVVTKIRPLDAISAGAPPETVSLAVEHSIEQSLRALGTNSVDALLVHRWSDWGRAGGAVAQCLQRYKEDGVSRLVGASLATPGDLVDALRDTRIGYIQLPFNLLDRRWLEPEVQAALAARPDVVITVRSVFLQGLLVALEGPWPPGTGTDPEQVRVGLRAACEALGKDSLMDLCLAYVRGQEWVTSVVLGAETPQQITEQADLMARPSLSPAEIEKIHDLVPPGSEDLVDPSRWRKSQ